MTVRGKRAELNLVEDYCDLDRKLINSALGWDPVDPKIEELIRKQYPIIQKAYNMLEKENTDAPN